MITTYGVKRNMYCSRVQSEVISDDLFEEFSLLVIDIETEHRPVCLHLSVEGEGIGA